MICDDFPELYSNEYCCKAFEEAIKEEFNDIAIENNDYVLIQYDLFSRSDKIQFCPFCGMNLKSIKNDNNNLDDEVNKHTTSICDCQHLPNWILKLFRHKRHDKWWL